MKIFLTGSNGYIGRNFIKKASKNNQIFALTRKKKNPKMRNVKWLVGEIDKNWKELKQTDILVHLATVGAYKKNSDFDTSYDFNVRRSNSLLINAIKANCKKWLIISTNKEDKIIKLVKSKKKIYPNSKEPHFNYALTKYIFSNLCKSYSKIFYIKCRIIKLFHIYGRDEPKQRLWPLLNSYAKNNKNLKMTSGNQKYDFNHIDDVVEGLISTLNFNKKNKKSFPQEWELASGKSMSVKQFAIKIWKRNKSKSKILFSKVKNFDSSNYLTKKKKLWKINYRHP
tara:strand:+ start:2802 stop:3650 length:849 start_codon:yes stop_codon:yes gene_type:complete